MKTFERSLTVVGALLFLVDGSAQAQAQARLTIVNQSYRELTIKVMRAGDFEDTLHGTMTILPMSSRTMSFSETGVYFMKTMASLPGRDPIYQKGQPFRVFVGSGGYSVLTVTFTIVESAAPQLTDGRSISRDEFDRDSAPHR